MSQELSIPPFMHSSWTVRGNVIARSSMTILQDNNCIPAALAGRLGAGWFFLGLLLGIVLMRLLKRAGER
jgi:hypothetical protein